MRAKCTTNLGKTIEVKGAYRGSLKGDMAYFRIYRNSKGETMLKTYGTRIKLRLTWSSAASGGVPATDWSRTTEPDKSRCELEASPATRRCRDRRSRGSAVGPGIESPIAVLPARVLGIIRVMPMSM